uniref:Uncharacterized protein n=1 Tax=Strongyloides venezuelensis TaxID=75913 RepID=A0A0K0FKN1_STRVS
MNRQNCFEESLSLENCHYFKAARRKGKRNIYEEEKNFKIIQNYSFWWYKNKCYQNKETINILKILSTFLFILSFLTSSVFAASGFREPIWENQKYTTQSFYLPRKFCLLNK